MTRSTQTAQKFMRGKTPKSNLQQQRLRKERPQLRDDPKSSIDTDLEE